MLSKTLAMTVPMMLGVLFTLATGLLRVETFEMTEGNAYGYPLPWTGEVGFNEPARTVYNWGAFVADVLFYAAFGYGVIFLVILSRHASIGKPLSNACSTVG